MDISFFACQRCVYADIYTTPAFVWKKKKETRKRCQIHNAIVWQQKN